MTTALGEGGGREGPCTSHTTTSGSLQWVWPLTLNFLTRRTHDISWQTENEWCLAPLHLKARTSVSFEQFPQLLCILCRCRFRSSYSFLETFSSPRNCTDIFFLIASSSTSRAAATQLNTPPKKARKSPSRHGVRTRHTKSSKMVSSFMVLMSLFARDCVDAIRHRCPTYFRETGCLTPRAHVLQWLEIGMMALLAWEWRTQTRSSARGAAFKRVRRAAAPSKWN